jgi:hypothetical protein
VTGKTIISEGMDSVKVERLEPIQVMDKIIQLAMRFQTYQPSYYLTFDFISSLIWHLI